MGYLLDITHGIHLEKALKLMFRRFGNIRTLVLKVPYHHCPKTCILTQHLFFTLYKHIVTNKNAPELLGIKFSYVKIE